MGYAEKCGKSSGSGFLRGSCRGGVGAVFVGAPAWYDGDMGRPFWSDEHLPLERKIVDSIHKHGCPAFLQFRDMANLIPTPQGPRAASAVNNPSKLDLNNALPKAMTLDDIHQEQNLVLNAASEGSRAGYDGVELNAACSHIFATFLSRFWNKRNDQYGPQNLDNRARFMVEMIQQIKQRCGADFPVCIIINGFEINVVELGNNEDCINVEESAALAKVFEKAGADLIHVRSAALGDHPKGFFPDLFYLTGSANNGYGYDFDFKKFWPEFVTQYGGAAGFPRYSRQN